MRQTLANKMVIIGVDALVWPVVAELRRRDELPALGRLLERGCMTPLRSCLPVWTPTNWASVSTGAVPGRHGVIKWYALAADGTTRISAFDARAVQSETIWSALGRAGRSSLVIHYPAAWPCSDPAVAVIDGHAQPGLGVCPFEIAPPAVYVLGEHPDPSLLRAQGVLKPQHIRPQPHADEATRYFSLPIGGRAHNEELYQRLIVSGDADGRTFLWLDPDQPERMVAETRTGQWTGWIQGTVADQVMFTRYKVIASQHPDAVIVYRSQAMPAQGFGTDWACTKYVELLGPFLEHASTIPYRTGLVDFDTVLEDAAVQAEWMIEASLAALRQDDADFALFHWHFIDHLNHDHLHMLDPDSPAYDPDQAEHYWDIFAKAYRVVDQMVARALEEADPTTVVGVVSDHGCVSDKRAVNLRKFLWRRGFLAVNGDEHSLDHDRIAETEIDWARTTAYVPDEKVFGIRIHAEESQRQQVIEAVLTALRSWIDPQTGRCPIQLALTRVDAQAVGLFGPMAEDINIVWAADYASSYFEKWHAIVGHDEVGVPQVLSSHHAGLDPLAHTAMTSNLATMILAGPGIKPGYRRDGEQLGIPSITSVAPTLCVLLGVDPPYDCEAGPLWDCLVAEDEITELTNTSAETYLVAQRLEDLGYL